MERTLKAGDPVIFTDEQRVDHHALVTTVHLAGGHDFSSHEKAYGQPPCINLLYVTCDERKVDQYGQQIERKSSVTWRNPSQRVAGGYFYRFSDEQ